MRRIAQEDDNQRVIVQSLRQLGFHVWHTHAVGNGGPDLVVTGYSHIAQRIESLLVELKVEGGKLTMAEKRWHEQFPKYGPLIEANSVEEILKWFGWTK